MPVPNATTVSVNGPQKCEATVWELEYGFVSPAARSPMLMVMSSAALPGVPLSSTTRTFFRGTSPQLWTVPLKGMLVVPNGTVAGQVLVTSTHGEVGIVVVQLLGAL